MKKWKQNKAIEHTEYVQEFLGNTHESKSYIKYHDHKQEIVLTKE